MSEALFQYVIYFNPKDYPDRYVVRKWRITAGKLEAAIWPDTVTETLESARDAVPEGLVNIGRQLGDDPVIVEVWT